MLVFNQFKNKHTLLSIANISLKHVDPQRDLHEDVHCRVVYDSGEKYHAAIRNKGVVSQ